MKKKLLFCIVPLCILSLFLSSCATRIRKFESSRPIEDIEQVAIYYTDKVYTERNIHNFTDELEPFCYIDATLQSGFIDELTNFEFEEVVNYFPVIPTSGGYDYSGYIIGLIYADGYDLFAAEAQYAYTLDFNGQSYYSYGSMSYCGDYKWSDFIEKYIPSDLEKPENKIPDIS